MKMQNGPVPFVRGVEPFVNRAVEAALLLLDRTWDGRRGGEDLSEWTSDAGENASDGGIDSSPDGVVTDASGVSMVAYRSSQRASVQKRPQRRREKDANSPEKGDAPRFMRACSISSSSTSMISTVLPLRGDLLTSPIISLCRMRGVTWGGVCEPSGV